MTDTTRTLQRMAASTRPATANDAQRTVELVISSASDVGDGVILSLDRLPEFGPAPVPVLLSHVNAAREMAGRITDLRIEAGELIGLAQFTDAPAADVAWPMARSGTAVSVGATYSLSDLKPGPGGADVATRWRLREVSLVPVGADPVARTRAAAPLPIASVPMTITTTQATQADDDMPKDPATLKAERAHQKLELAVRRSAAEAGLSAEETQAIIDDHRGKPEVEAVAAVVRAYRIKLEERAPVYAGHPARFPVVNRSTASQLTQAIAAKMGATGADIDRSLAQVPVHLLLRDYLANDPEMRGIDLNRTAVTRLVNRAWSTSDFKQALESSAERMLLSAYQEAQVGVLALATSRDLPDFRAMEMLRISQYGEITEKLQGGEYKSAKYSEEEAATLQAAEYGSIATLTRRALANDNLGIFGELVAEMGRACARKERKELAQRLLHDFTWTAANSTTTSGGLSANFANGITAATLKLRRQKDVEGNDISFEPRLLLVAPEEEAVARQALGEYVPNNSADVMPFRTLRIEVDHHLPGGTFYVADTAYPSLVIGRIGGQPIISNENEFSTGNERFRVQHDFGTAVLDQRSIVKIDIEEAEA